MMQFETNPLKKYTRPNKQVILQDPQFNNIEIRIFSNFEINNVDSKPMTLDIGPSFKQIFLNFNLLSNSLNIFGASDCIHAFIVAFALPLQYRVVTRFLAYSDLHLAYLSFAFLLYGQTFWLGGTRLLWSMNKDGQSAS